MTSLARGAAGPTRGVDLEGGDHPIADEALSAAAAARAREVATRFDAELGLRAASGPYQPQRHQGPRPGVPVLHLDDVSGVPFLQDIVGVQHYQLRARVRAGDGDLFAAACGAVPSYERYCAERLGLGAPDFIEAAPVGPPIEVAEACRHGQAFATLVARARAARGLVLHPYMGIEAVWALANDLARAAEVEVDVVAPPPPVTWLANDKARLTALVDALVPDVLGTPAVVPTRVARDPDALTDHLAALAAAHDHVALKMTRFASAMGNRVFDAAALRALDRAALGAVVERFLADKEWTPGEEVLAVRWIPDAPSPSTQLWIPPSGQGAPRLDGIYEQLLVGPERVFLGSIPSRLGARVHAWLAQASLLVAAAFQAVGYVGRCSFDFVLDGEQPLFVECNGRWGGTSTPMHLVDRLFPGAPQRPPYRARDVVAPAWAGRDFAELAEHLGEEWLFDPRTGRGRFILYNVGCLPFGKFDVIALGDSVDDASHHLETVLPGLLGR